MRTLLSVTLLAGFVLGSLPVRAATEAARVNDHVITQEEVNGRLLEITRANPAFAPTRKQVIDELIKRELAIQEARKIKLDQDPIVIERINNVLYLALIEKQLGAEFERMTLSDSEAKGWYQKNPEIRTSHIYIALPPGATQEEEAKASKRLVEIQGEIKAGKFSFAEAAQKFSEDPSSAMGGDLDYRMKDRLDPSFYRAALKLGKPGDMSGPVRTPFGMHLIRLTGKKSWIESDRSQVKRIILEERRQERVSELLNGLRQKAKVSISDRAL
jgi:peptidyl-prolyl cis-trans isomerase C/peptidyl-prolyl cis-trans isomerase D